MRATSSDNPISPDQTFFDPSGTPVQHTPSLAAFAAGPRPKIQLDYQPARRSPRPVHGSGDTHPSCQSRMPDGTSCPTFLAGVPASLVVGHVRLHVQPRPGRARGSVGRRKDADADSGSSCAESVSRPDRRADPLGARAETRPRLQGRLGADQRRSHGDGVDLSQRLSHQGRGQG